MSCRKSEGVPFMPGNIYADPTLQDYRKTQVFDYINGFPIPKTQHNGIGGVPLESKCTVKDLFDECSYDPTLTYGRPKERPLPPFIPSFVALEKKCLEFMAYYKETVNDSNWENYRVRHVRIHYYLEDDSMMVIEPRVENSGLMQGKFLKRHRIPKNCVGECYHWKDLNIACDLMVYGRVFRIYDCNEWTKLFYESEGLILNDPEDSPRDPYIDKRIQAGHINFTC